MNRPLPKKEADLFKSLVKHYELKLYKKGIKAADTILRKFPNHGETLAMKGLTLNCTGKRDDAYDFVKRGLRNDMRSHVCWHVFGLLHRSDRNYNEAIKAYKQALRIDPENLQILRDLSLLQVQMRDLNGFALTRHTILNLKPNNKIHWLAFALAKHLTNDLEGCISVIDCYLGTLNENSPELRQGFESSELAMYRHMVMDEIPNNETLALEHLEKCKDLVVDQTTWLQAKGTDQLMLGQFDEAKQTFLKLFQYGASEDYKVHSGYMCAVLQLDKSTCQRAMKATAMDVPSTMMSLSQDQKQVTLDAYKNELLPINPRSHALRRIPLTMLQGKELRDALDAYCRRDLSKGVPFLGSDLSSLFLVEQAASNKEEKSAIVRVTDPVDVKVHPMMNLIIDLVEGYMESLSTNSRFPGQADDEEEPPSTLLWVYYLRCQMYEMCGEYQAALDMIEKCIEHTPTAVEMYERKARILKLSGDIQVAADCLDSARELDLQDRYINNKATKYLLRANREEVALERMSLFTRHEGNPEQNLYDMQCTWYELELANCLKRQGKWGPCLKKFVAIEKHFEDFHEDQFDFHSYCVRKVTLRAYVDVLRFEDNIWGHDFYGRAAKGIIKCYLHLFDSPADAKPESEVPDYSSMTAAERKKAKAIARKKKKAAEKKAAIAAEEGKEANGGDKNKKKGGVATKPDIVDEDPNGDLLLKKDPLEEAKKYTAILTKNAPRRFSTWILSYDVAMRRGKKMMALQALFKAHKIDPESSELFSRIVDFAINGPKGETAHSAVSEVILSEIPVLLGGKTVSEYVSSAANKVKSDVLTNLPTRIAVAEALVSTNIGTPGDAATLIVDGGLDGRMASIKNCRLALKCITKLGDSTTDARDVWISKVKERFPQVTDLN